MDYLLNDEESDNDLASKILYFLIQGFSCYHASLRAGIFKFSSAPQAVFPVQKKRSAPTGASSYHIRTSIKVSGPQSGPFFKKSHEFI